MTPLNPDGNLLITLFNGLGDAFLALPFLRKVERRYAGHQVFLATYDLHSQVFFKELDFKLLLCRFHPGMRHATAFLDDPVGSLDVQQIVSLNFYYPNAVDLEVSHHFRGHPRWGFYTPSGEVDIDGGALPTRHMRDLYFDVARWPASYRVADRQIILKPSEFAAIAEFLRKADREGRFYALHLDSSPEKMWAVENWLKVVSHIGSRWQVWPLIIGQRSEASQVLEREILLALKTPPDFGLRLNFAAVQAASAFIGIDSLFAHVADAYEKPLLVLFGPTDPTLWRPVGPWATLVQPEGGGGMNQLSVDRVIAEVDTIFASLS